MALPIDLNINYGSVHELFSLILCHRVSITRSYPKRTRMDGRRKGATVTLLTNRRRIAGGGEEA